VVERSRNPTKETGFLAKSGLSSNIQGKNPVSEYLHHNQRNRVFSRLWVVIKYSREKPGF
jgi:hypothetical protein